MNRACGGPGSGAFTPASGPLGIRSKQGCGAKYAAIPAGTSAVPSPVDAASSPIAASAVLLDHQLEN